MLRGAIKVLASASAWPLPAWSRAAKAFCYWCHHIWGALSGPDATSGRAAATQLCDWDAPHKIGNVEIFSCRAAGSS